MSTNKMSLEIIRKELERLSRISNTPGVGLSYDDVRCLEILIKTEELLKRVAKDDPEEKQQDFSKVSNEELERLLNDAH
jgi:hypothetical protein